jgi:hypothetical protein
MPYEVRGGVALHASELWSFVQDMQRLELASPDEERRKHCRGFLTKGLEKKAPIRLEFTAYGQASLEMATGVFACRPEEWTRLTDRRSQTTTADG